MMESLTLDVILLGLNAGTAVTIPLAISLRLFKWALRKWVDNYENN